MALGTDTADALTGEVTTAEPVGSSGALPELVTPSPSESSSSHGLHSLILLPDLVPETETDDESVQSTASKKGVMQARYAGVMEEIVLDSAIARPRSLNDLVMREDSGSIFSPEDWYLDGSAHQSPSRKRGH
jgi:hypothetical protein